MSERLADKPDTKKYGKLLVRLQPQVIRTDHENDRRIQELFQLREKEHLTPEEEKIAELLVVLIDQYEEAHFPIPDVSPVEMILFLMDQHDLKQVDLKDVFGTDSITSAVLNRKRALAKAHIKKLAAKFHVSPALFFGD